MTSQSVEDYLKAILEIEEVDGRATTGALARRLDITPASVTAMLRKLASSTPRLITYEKHRGAVLTAAGRRSALEILRHHRLIEKFLHDTLGYTWDEVHSEAERLEHAISETLEDRIAEKLGDPEIDPHGHPIPRRDGSVPERGREVRLIDLTAGAHGTVSRVPDDDGELLRYLAEIGMRLGQRFEVQSVQPFDGPHIIRVGSDGPEIPLSRQVASKIFALPVD